VHQDLGPEVFHEQLELYQLLFRQYRLQLLMRIPKKPLAVRLRGASQHGTEAAHQLAGAERFRQVVAQQRSVIGKISPLFVLSATQTTSDSKTILNLKSPR
jgi:hypothetical protein